MRPRRVPGHDSGHASRAKDHRGLPLGRGASRLARTRSWVVSGNRAILPTWLHGQPGQLVDSRPRRGRDETLFGGKGRRRWVRSRGVHSDHGEGVPKFVSRWLRLPPGLGGRSPSAGRSGRCVGQGDVRASHGQGLFRHGIRLDRLLRLSPRHGRPRWRPCPRPPGARPGWHRHVGRTALPTTTSAKT